MKFLTVYFSRAFCCFVPRRSKYCIRNYALRYFVCSSEPRSDYFLCFLGPMFTHTFFSVLGTMFSHIFSAFRSHVLAHFLCISGPFSHTFSVFRDHFLTHFLDQGLVYFLFLCPSISHYLSDSFAHLIVRDQVSHIYKPANKIIASCVLIFAFTYRNIDTACLSFLSKFDFLDEFFDFHILNISVIPLKATLT
jgi:hypothetical protein